MIIWKLPLDVVMNIIAFSSPTGIVSMMETCHMLHTEGPKCLLRDGVTLHTARDIMSFAAFMFAEGTIRFRYLHKLHLAVGALEYRPFDDDGRGAAADRLVELLQCPALSLHSLGLGKAEELLSSSPPVRAAFRTLASVRQLVASRIGPATVVTLRKMPSMLVSATIDHLHPTLFPLTSCDQVLAMLAPSSDTLEELSLAANGIFDVAEHPANICFPRVRVLKILSNSCRFLATWLAAFPNVQILQHNASKKPQSSMISQTTIASFVEGLSGARQWNAGFSLSTLTECSSDLLSLCVLGPAFTAVQKLRISTQFNNLEALVLLRMALMDGRPSELELSVLSIDTLESVVCLIGAPELHMLRTLRVNFSFGEEDCAYGVKASALECLCDVVEDLPPGITTFDMILHASSCGFLVAGWQLDDEDLETLRDRFSACRSCDKRVVLQPAYDGLPTLPCEDSDDDDSEAWSDQSEWGSATYSSDGEKSEWADDWGSEGAHDA